MKLQFGLKAVGLCIWTLVLLPQAHAENLKCRTDQRNNLELLERWAKAESAAYPNENSEKAAAIRGQRATEISSYVETCKRVLKELKVDSCFTNIQKYARETTLLNANEGKIGSGVPVTTDAFLKSRRADTFELPPEFKNGLPSNWKEIADQRGWTYVQYRSASVVAEPHNSHGRLAFRIPTPTGSKWLQFSTPKNLVGEPRADYLIDMIDMQFKKDGKPGAVSHTQFYRQAPQGEFKTKGDIASCTRCHAMGPRFIRPALGSIWASNASKMEVGKLIVSDNADTGSKAFDHGFVGPSVGKKQQCTQCHDKPGAIKMAYGQIHSRYEINQIKNKMVDMLHMPPELLGYVYPDLKSAFQKFEELPQETRMKHMRARKDDSPLDYKDVLGILLDEKKLTQAEYDRLQGRLLLARKDATELFEGLVKDYRSELKNWLAGGKPTCETPETVANRSAGKGYSTPLSAD